MERGIGPWLRPPPIASHKRVLLGKETMEKKEN
jgi:hypothetical protein